MLNQGAAPSTVVADIEASTEYFDDVVTALYEHYLKRAPDSVGLTAYAHLLAGGATIEQVAADIVASPEFFQNEGENSNSGYVNALYEYILDRSPDSAGYSSWLKALNGGASRTTVATAFLTSQEYDTDLLVGVPWNPAYNPTTDWGGYYAEFLLRSADPNGLAGWLAALQAGTTDQTVLAGILGSVPEGYGKWS